MERVVANSLTWYLEENKLICKNQSGFRKGHSTIDHIAKLKVDIKNAFLNKQHLIAITLDINKAYDTVWR